MPSCIVQEILESDPIVVFIAPSISEAYHIRQLCLPFVTPFVSTLIILVTFSFFSSAALLAIFVQHLVFRLVPSVGSRT